MASPDKMTAVELAEAALAAHKALIEGHKEEFANTAAAFAAREFGAGGYKFDARGVQMALGIHPSGKRLAFKFLPQVRAQFEAQWASNKADYDSWMESAKALREQDMAKLKELETALEAAKAAEVEEIFVPEEVPDVAPGNALLAALAAVGYVPVGEPTPEEEDVAIEAALREQELDKNAAEMAVEELDDTPSDEEMAELNATMAEQAKRAKLPEAESWADAADDEKAAEEAAKLAKLKRMFALTQPGKSYAAAIRAY